MLLLKEMRKYIVKAVHNITKQNVSLIILFSAIYGFLNPTLGTLAGQATVHSQYEYYNIAIVFYSILILTIGTVTLEYFYTKKTVSRDIASRFLMANIFLLIIAVVALKTASHSQQIAASHSNPPAGIGDGVRELGNVIYYFALFMHIGLVKILSLLFPSHKKKHN